MFGGHKLRAVFFADKFFGLILQEFGHIERVRTHVGNQTDGLPGNFDTFVEVLGRHHGFLRGKTQFVVGVLLHGTGNKGRFGFLFNFFFLYFGNGVGAFAQNVGKGGQLFRFIKNGIFNFVIFRKQMIGGRLFHIFPLPFGYARPKFGGGLRFFELGADSPVFLFFEFGDFFGAFGQQADGYRLHTPGRKAGSNFAPQKRGKFVTHNAIQNTAGLLGVHKVVVNFARMGKRFLNSGGGNFVKENALVAFFGEF